jgi:signal peptidase I
MFVKRLGAFFLDILEVIVFAVAIFLFVYLLILQPHKIKGASMEPNFPNGEYLLTDKVTYRFREPRRGEIIVFEAPGQNAEEYIKRIIGLPNEKILIENNKIFINGKELREPYISNSILTSPGTFLKEEVQIPSNNYIVLGDNRPFSSDSRAWGFVPKEKITGKAWFIYWPLKSIGAITGISYQ